MIERRDKKMTDREVVERWDAYRISINRDAAPVMNEGEAEKKARIKKLLNDFEAFSKYYFPNYCTSPFAPFHLRFARKIAKSERLYIVRAWARDHAKSVVAGLLVPIFEMANGRLFNMLMVSHTVTNATELLMPIMLHLENNQRFIADFGQQKSWRGWEVGQFSTAAGVSFRAIGAGQSPRGTRKEERRPDYILIDDIDTDEEARNEGRLKAKWDWIEKALLPTVSIDKRYRLVFVGNIIAKKGIIARAAEKADDFEQIDILDKNGNPSWSARYTKEQVNYMLAKISYASAQSEYFNNPISEGTVFKDITYGKVPPLSKFRHLVAYCDASYSQSRKNDFKATVLVGEKDGTYYVIKAFLEQTTLNQMLLWFYDIRDMVADKTQLYYCIECNGFQDPWYKDVFLPGLQKIEATKGTIPISPDDRNKPDKFSRIEGNLEPLNRRGLLVFNEAEKENPHMTRLEEQFKAIEPALPAHDDGPDATEGAVWVLNIKLREMAPIKVGQYRRTSKRF